MQSRKRAASSELQRDGEENPGDEGSEINNAPRFASPEVMATRRILKANRPATADGEGSASANPFKGLATKFGIPSTAPAEQKDTAGDKPATAAATSATTGAPAFSFSFGGGSGGSSTGKPGETTIKSAFGTAPVTVPSGAFSFASQSTSATTQSTGAFSFGGASPAVAKPSEEKADGAEEEKKPAAPVFGAGAKFQFGSMVNSFKEGRKVLETTAPSAGAAAAAADPEDAPKLQPSESTVVVSGETLAKASVKMYLFKKGEDGAAAQWVEAGEGDAKVKKEKLDDKDVYRVTVRDGRSLNNRLGKGLFLITKEDKKYIIITVPVDATTPSVYMLKFLGAEAEKSKEEFTTALKKAMESAEAAQ